jgi:hypothetical protein
MDQYVGMLPCLLDEIESLIEKFIDLVLLMILCGQIEIGGHVLFAVPEQPAPSH